MTEATHRPGEGAALGPLGQDPGGVTRDVLAHDVDGAGDVGAGRFPHVDHLSVAFGAHQVGDARYNHGGRDGTADHLDALALVQQVGKAVLLGVEGRREGSKKRTA